VRQRRSPAPHVVPTVDGIHDRMSLLSLRSAAKAQGLSGYSRLSKAALITLLKDSQ
jgi:hypothetical protein